LSCKRNLPGSSLTNAEDAEEAQLTARVAAYQETAEGRGRERCDELWLQSFMGLTPEEKGEYEHLKTLYPDEPMDPDDPMKPVLDMIMERDAARARRSHDDEGP
jgi:hypothetical protein